MWKVQVREITNTIQLPFDRPNKKLNQDFKIFFTTTRNYRKLLVIDYDNVQCSIKEEQITCNVHDYLLQTHDAQSTEQDLH